MTLNFITSNLQEDYTNPSTLVSRWSSLRKRIKLNDYNQIQQNANSSAPGTMITTAPEVYAETTMLRDHNRPIYNNRS